MNILAKAVEVCPADHPPMQHNWHHWSCPICGKPLARDLIAKRAHAHCKKLHSDDQLACSDVNCPFTGYGNFVAKLLATHGHLCLCTTCHGAGHDPGTTGPCQVCNGRGYIALVPTKGRRREATKEIGVPCHSA